MCTEEQLAEAGVTKGMIRISVGLEEVGKLGNWIGDRLNLRFA